MSQTFGTFVDAWLSRRVNFGGEWMTRTEVYAWFKAAGLPVRVAELWLLGYENVNGREEV